MYLIRKTNDSTDIMTEVPLSFKGKSRMYWATVGASVRKGFEMHRSSGQLARNPENGVREWGNVTEHCLVEVARADILAKWTGLPNDLIYDMKMAAFLHDFDKRQEIAVTKKANADGESPLIAVRAENRMGDDLLADAGFSERVIRLAGSAGGDVPQLIEAQRILNQETLSDEDLAYLIVHYVDDCSAGSKWVRSSNTTIDGRRLNMIDYRAEENKSKSTYTRISQEIGEELIGTPFEGMNNHDAMAVVSHQIERKLSQRIFETTGEEVDPLAIPELIDQKIREDIEQI